MHDTDIAIKIENVVKRYSREEFTTSMWWRNLLHNEKTDVAHLTDDEHSFWALKGVSATIHRGEAVGVIGRNGSGKSTLLKILSNITVPTGGRVVMNGRVASMLEVGTGFHPDMTGLENIRMNGAILGMAHDEIEAKIEDIIQFSECEDFINTPVKHYSSGMYVKLAFSVAAHLDSDILLMDEVLAVGDAQFQKKCLDKMHSVVHDDNRTVLFVSHNMDNITKLCTRCILLEKGVMVLDDTVDKVVPLYLGAEIENDMHENKQTLPVTETLPTVYNLSDLPRPLTKEFCIHMERFEFLNKTKAVYTQGERVEIQIDWAAEKPIEDIRLQLLLVRVDTGDHVGVALSSVLPIETQGTKTTTRASINFGTLAAGAYCVQPVLGGMAGVYLDSYDVVSLPIVFAVVLSDDAVLRHEWPVKDWGSLIFDDIKLLD